MTVLVDTSVWSLALRRHPGNLSQAQETLRRELAELIREGRARLIGPVRQELLSGVRTDAHFQRLREHLRAFDDTPLAPEDFEEAARASTKCRAACVAGSSVDFLICSVAIKLQCPILTTDRDFIAYARHLPLRLHTPR